MIDFSRSSSTGRTTASRPRKPSAACPGASGRPTPPLPTPTAASSCWAWRSWPTSLSARWICLTGKAHQGVLGYRQQPQQDSVNVLSSKDVFVQEVDGDHIVVINVPRAERSYKPVYVDGNPLNTYRRNGEGDYRCTREEYQSMVRGRLRQDPGYAGP